jgi:hypothetical protein
MSEETEQSLDAAADDAVTENEINVRSSRSNKNLNLILP